MYGVFSNQIVIFYYTLTIFETPLSNNLWYNLDILKMLKIINLVIKIETQLPAGLVNFMQLAGEVAYRHGQNLYLVGGAVRDLLLGQTNNELG